MHACEHQLGICIIDRCLTSPGIEVDGVNVPTYQPYLPVAVAAQAPMPSGPHQCIYSIYMFAAQQCYPLPS